MAPGAHQRGERLDDPGRTGHVLQHFEAGDHVEAPRPLGGKVRRGLQPVVDLDAGLQCVQPCHFQRAARQVDADDPGAASRHALGDQPAAAADVEGLPAGQPGPRLDEVDAQGVQVVQRPELPGRIPPPLGHGLELGELGRVDVFVGLHGAIVPRLHALPPAPAFPALRRGSRGRFPAGTTGANH